MFVEYRLHCGKCRGISVQVEQVIIQFSSFVLLNGRDGLLNFRLQFSRKQQLDERQCRLRVCVLQIAQNQRTSFRWIVFIYMSQRSVARHGFVSEERRSRLRHEL